MANGNSVVTHTDLSKYFRLVASGKGNYSFSMNLDHSLQQNLIRISEQSVMSTRSTTPPCYL